MVQFFQSLGNAIMDNLMVPVIVIIAGGLIAIFQPKINKLVQKHLAKEDMKEINEENTIRKDLIALIDSQVQSAVAANMSLANYIRRENNGNIPDEEGKKLAENAKQLVMNSLPVSLTDKDGNLNKILGGTDRLEAIIETSLKKYVYEYKFKQQEASIVNQPVKKTRSDLFTAIQMNNQNSQFNPDMYHSSQYKN